MFKLQPNPTFPATVKVPSPDGEKLLKLIFKHKTRDELAAYFEEAAKGERAEADSLMEVISGWEDVDAAFSRESLVLLIQNHHGAVRAIFDAYLSELSGAKEKN